MPEALTTFSGERLRAAQAVFDAVVDLPEPQRSAELALSCGADAELRAFVQRLLSSEQRGIGTFLETTFVSAEVLGDSVSSAALPRQIGPFEIVRKLGEGGMGVVYEARQNHPRRTVALKLIRPGFANAALLRRFQFEADVLGQLQHPGIAHIYEAGVADGVAYFAMEFIRGRPLNNYAAVAGLGSRAILELVAQIADAVQHAHLKGVIHRDLKPGNILVVDEEAENSSASGLIEPPAPPKVSRRPLSPARAQPRILDFGVARVIGTDMAALTMHTEAGQLVGTVPYMSPEQVMGESQQLDVRSDVYALGVILFELLTGRLPLEVRNCTLIEAARIIREEEPSRLAAIAGRAGPATRFDRDIETIVAKALEKDRERRYQSAAELAADIRRHLHDEPIQARPASAVYQLRKFTKRHRAVVIGLAATITALTIGLIGMIWFAMGEREQRGQVEKLLIETRAARDAEKEQRDRAEKSRAWAQQSEAETAAVLAFLLNDVIGATAPEQGGYALTVVQALDAAAGNIEARFADRPRLAVLLHEKIGEMYRTLGEFGAAVRECRRAAELATASFSDDDGRILQSEMALVDALADARHWDEVLPLARRLAEQTERVFGPDAKESLSAATVLGDALQVKGKYAEAEPLLRRVRESAKRLYPDDQLTYRALNVLNACMEAQGRVDENLRREEYEGTLRIMGPIHPLTLVALNNYAVCLTKLQKDLEAEALLREALVVLKARLPAGHALLGELYNNLSTVLSRLMRMQESADAALRSVAILAPALGEKDAATQRSRRQAVRALLRAKKVEEAQAFLRETIAARVRAGDPADIADLTLMRAELSWGLAEFVRDCDAAERWIREALPAEAPALAADDAAGLFCALARAWCRFHAGQREDANALRAAIMAALDAAPAPPGALSSWIRGSCNRLQTAVQPDSASASQPGLP